MAIKISVGPAILGSADVEALIRIVQRHAQATPTVFVGREQRALPSAAELVSASRAERRHVFIATPSNDVQINLQPAHAWVRVERHPGCAHQLAAAASRGFDLRPLGYSPWFVAVVAVFGCLVTALFVSANSPHTYVSYGGAVAFTALAAAVVLLLTADIIGRRGAGVIVKA